MTDLSGEERSLVGQRETLRRALAENERRLLRIEMELTDTRKFLDSDMESLPFTERAGTLLASNMHNVFGKLSAERARLD